MEAEKLVIDQVVPKKLLGDDSMMGDFSVMQLNIERGEILFQPFAQLLCRG